MLKEVYTQLRNAHIVMGFVCVAAFWAVAFAKKGGRVHVRCGVTYVFSLAIVLATAALASFAIIYDPHLKVPDRPLAEIATPVRIGQLGLLWATLLTFVSAAQGMRALGLRRSASPDKLDPYYLLRAAHIFCVLTAVALAVANILSGSYMIAAIAAIMITAAVWNLRAAQAFGRHPQDWYLEHLRGMLLSGVFVQAIFAMVTLTRYAQSYGQWAVAGVWVLPFGIGLVGVRLAFRYFSNRLRGAQPAAPAGPHGHKVMRKEEA